MSQLADDRADFAARARNRSRRLGEDSAAFRQSLDMIVSLDAHDYPYLWTWLGVPIIQLPADIMAIQEAVWASKPDVIVETGIARGGSVIFLASLLHLLGRGRVIGVDVDIRPHNRQTIEDHPLADRIELVSGSSTDPATLLKVRSEIPSTARVMVILDSNHSRDHVLAELRAYAPLVTSGCYLIVADTLLGHMSDAEAPTNRSRFLSKGDDPLSARDAFLAETDRFVVDEVMNGKMVLSASPGGYLRCVS
ncbi:MAG: CmcI family methyltransferase [Pseudomonadota bacterium]